jgi:hypothetical protein
MTDHGIVNKNDVLKYMVEGKHPYSNKFQFPILKKFGSLVIGHCLELACLPVDRGFGHRDLTL